MERIDKYGLILLGICKDLIEELSDYYEFPDTVNFRFNINSEAENLEIMLEIKDHNGYIIETYPIGLSLRKLMEMNDVNFYGVISFTLGEMIGRYRR